MNQGIKHFVLPALALTVICAVVIAILSFVHAGVKTRIEEQKKLAADAGKFALIAEAEGFDPVAGEFPEGTVSVDKEISGKGYIVVSVSQGYAGEYRVMTAVGTDGRILGITVLEENETPDIGGVVKDPKYLAKFVGKDQNLEGIDFVTGATITSGALKDAIRTAFSAHIIATGGTIEEEVVVPPEEQIFPGAALEEIELEGAIQAYRVNGGEGALIVTYGEGYNKGVDIMTGFDAAGNIVGARATRFGDTPRLGDRAIAPEYLDLFIGVEDIGSVDGIANATYSVDGVKAAIKAARTIFENSKEALIGE